MPKRYIGTKIILAEPKEKQGAQGYEVLYEDGYLSWSPKETFERAYRLMYEDGYLSWSPKETLS